MFYNTKTNERLSTQELRELIYDYWYDTIDDNWLDNLIDDMYEPFNIFNISYAVSDIFKTVDPIAYDCLRIDEVEFQTDDTMYDIDRAVFSDGDTLSDWNLDFVIYKEEENE